MVEPTCMDLPILSCVKIMHVNCATNTSHCIYVFIGDISDNNLRNLKCCGSFAC
jgi:hypothetical protein